MSGRLSGNSDQPDVVVTTPDEDRRRKFDAVRVALNSRLNALGGIVKGKWQMALVPVAVVGSFPVGKALIDEMNHQMLKGAVARDARENITAEIARDFPGSRIREMDFDLADLRRRQEVHGPHEITFESPMSSMTLTAAEENALRRLIAQTQADALAIARRNNDGGPRDYGLGETSIIAVRTQEACHQFAENCQPTHTRGYEVAVRYHYEDEYCAAHPQKTEWYTDSEGNMRTRWVTDYSRCSRYALETDWGVRTVGSTLESRTGIDQISQDEEASNLNGDLHESYRAALDARRNSRDRDPG